MAGNLDRIEIHVPDGFDPVRHRGWLADKIAERYGEGFDIETFDAANHTVTAVRERTMTQAAHADSGEIEVRLPGKVKPSDGPKIADRLADQYEGYQMVEFRPFVARAKLARLSESEQLCRNALANALGCKPWEVGVHDRPDGGFDVALPRTYVPSKHDDKISEVATGVVGRDGWYVTYDTKALTAAIVPSDPPTFPASVPYPLGAIGAGEVDRTTFAMALPDPGQVTGRPVTIDWNASAWALLAGTPGSGKTVSLNGIIAHQVGNGARLAVVDNAAKSVDFSWCKDLCSPGWWGCDSLEAAATTLSLVYEEGQARAELLARAGVKNWLDLGADRFAPIFVAVDEMSALTVADPVPKGVPKDHPMVAEINRVNLARAMISTTIRKIVAELRFVGVRMVISTQATNASTGVPPSLRTLIGNFVLQGTKPSKAARSQIFPDETSVPQVPANVAADGKAGRGAGVALLEGRAPMVYKAFWASTDDMRRAVLATGAPTCPDPSPTPAQIARVFPDDEDPDDEEGDHRARRKTRKSVERGPSGRSAAAIAVAMGDAAGIAATDGSGPADAFARANAARHAAAGGGPTRAEKAAAREEAALHARNGAVSTTRAVRCTACGQGWINPATGICNRCGATG